MARVKKGPDGINRREFITRAGAVLVMGAVAAACTPSLKKELEALPVSAVIVHNPDACAGCGVCGLMCSLYHEGEVGPSLSRTVLIRDAFSAEYSVKVCQQCQSPSCYLACPYKDLALCIDEETGVKYINAENCDGCGKCVRACPFTPSNVRLHPVDNVAFKCDLCRGRPEGPICVEYCSMGALRVVSGAERG